MAHGRKRFIQPYAEKLISFSPLVGILGHRQVGKTTLLEEICKTYLTFDDEDVIFEAQKSAKIFLTQFKALKNGIDECQLVPKIFPALKERVRIDKRPGQFILSGSVRFTSKRAIRESLTGRLITIELLPFTVSELRHEKLPNTLHQILKSKNLSKLAENLNHDLKYKKDFEKYIQMYFERGGLPGLCFIQDARIRNEKLSDQLKTILDRDLRQIHETTLSYAEIRSFLGLIASSQGDQLNHSKIRKELGLSHATQKKLIYALEAVFLIRGIAIEGSTANTVYYLEDQAESVFLSPNQSDIELYEQFIYRNIRAEFNYQIGEDYKIFQFKTRGKARIPFCFSSAEGVIGVLPILENEPTRSHNASIQSFLRKYNNSKVVVVTSDRTRQKKSYAVDDRVIVVSEVNVI